MDASGIPQLSPNLDLFALGQSLQSLPLQRSLRRASTAQSKPHRPQVRRRASVPSRPARFAAEGWGPRTPASCQTSLALVTPLAVGPGETVAGKGGQLGTPTERPRSRGLVCRGPRRPELGCWPRGFYVCSALLRLRLSLGPRAGFGNDWRRHSA